MLSLAYGHFLDLFLWLGIILQFLFGKFINKIKILLLKIWGGFIASNVADFVLHTYSSFVYLLLQWLINGLWSPEIERIFLLLACKNTHSTFKFYSLVYYAQNDVSNISLCWQLLKYVNCLNVFKSSSYKLKNGSGGCLIFSKSWI